MPGSVDVHFREVHGRRFASLNRRWPPHAHSWFLHRQLADGSRYVRWTDLFEFLISSDGHRIEYRRLRQGTTESFSVYLLGQVLSFSLLAFGREPLHGTVVAVNGGAIGFLGNCGWGKSTLGAAFLTRGFRVITDDLVVLRKTGAGYQVQAGPARIKLFPRIARGVLGTAPGGVRMNPGTSKVILPLEPGQVSPTAVPLQALYVLSPPRRSDRASIRLEPLTGSDAFFHTISNSFNAIVDGGDRLERQFRFASELVHRVPVKRLSYPRSLSLLPAVCDKVLADLD
jgi:hypothetical protein